MSENMNVSKRNLDILNYYYTRSGAQPGFF